MATAATMHTEADRVREERVSPPTIQPRRRATSGFTKA
jgi:hypothetical protein